MIVSLWSARSPRACRLRCRKGTSGYRPIRRRRQTKQERVRPQGKKKHRASKAQPGVAQIRFVTEGERFLAGLLSDFNVQFQTQNAVEAIVTDLKGKGKTQFKPDFFLPDFDLYLEVCESRNELGLKRKASKINSAARAGKSVILIDLAKLAELANLKDHPYQFETFWSIICPEVFELSA